MDMEATWIEKLGGVWRRGYSGVSRVQKQVGHLGAHKKCNLAISIEESLARLMLMCVMNTRACLVLMYALLL